MPSYIQPKENGVYIHVRLQPRASRERIEGELGGRLKVRLTAPPVEGAANKALIKFFSRVLDVPKGAITIVRGEHSREKTILVSGVSAPEVEDHLKRVTRRR